MSAPSTSGLSVELLLRVIDVKYGYFTLLLPTPAVNIVQQNRTDGEAIVQAVCPGLKRHEPSPRAGKAFGFFDK